MIKAHYTCARPTYLVTDRGASFLYCIKPFILMKMINKGLLNISLVFLTVFFLERK